MYYILVDNVTIDYWGMQRDLIFVYLINFSFENFEYIYKYMQIMW